MLNFDIQFTQTSALAQAIVSTLEDFDDCLMWLVQWDINALVNLHLYYRLRESYGERTLVWEKPGHLFLGHERADLVTFVQVAILFDWEFHLMPQPSWQWVFVGDEYVVISSDKQSDVDERIALVLPFCTPASTTSAATGT